jgi:hypothetical protein
MFTATPAGCSASARQPERKSLIVGVILIDMPIFDVPLGVIVQRQPAIGINTEKEKDEILHASLSVSIAIVAITIVAITIVVLVALVGVVVQAKTDCADVMGMSNMVPGTSGK